MYNEYITIMNIIILIYSLILLCIIIYNAFKGTKNKKNIIEPFENANDNKTNNDKTNNDKTNNDKTNNDNKNIIILLGDSILKNNSYVKPGFSLEDLLIKTLEKTKDYNYELLNYAEEDGTVSDVYRQLEYIPSKYHDLGNKYNIKLFLSIGGNNILNLIKEEQILVINDSIWNSNVQDQKLLNIFDKYEHLINAIKAKFPFSNSELFLLNIYYPYGEYVNNASAKNDKTKDISANINNNKIKELYNYIKIWNNLLQDYVEKNKNNNTKLVNIIDAMKNKDDFTFVIEPSEKGGQKIANIIANQLL